MLTLNDIVNISFRKANFSGYRAEDVDAFIDQVKESYEELIQKSIKMKEELEKKDEELRQVEKKLEILAAKIEDYRGEEDEIKNALVSAQKLGDASIRESRHKAEIILKDANLKAERILAGAKNDVVAQQQELERLKKSSSDFRTQLLNLYKEHLTMINALPSYGKTEEPAQPPQAVPAPAAVNEEPKETVPAAHFAAAEDVPFSYEVEVTPFDAEQDASSGDTMRFQPVGKDSDQ